MRSLWFKIFIIQLFLVFYASCTEVSKSNEERGDRYYRNGYYDDSLAEYLMAEKTKGVTANLLRKIGKLYVMKGDFFQAKKYFDRYFSAHDSEPDADVLLDYLQIAAERGRAGDTTTMVRALEEILQIDPYYSLGRYYFDLGEFYYDHADYRKSIAYYLHGMPLHGELNNKAQHLFYLAESYEKLEDYFYAFLYFDQFVILYPDHLQVEQARWHRGSSCYPLAQEMFEQGDIEQSFYYLDQIISSGQPQHLVDDAYFLKGEILRADKRLEEAKQAFRQVLKLNRYYWKEKIAEQARMRIEEIDFSKR